jgi:hypothetical protein
MKKVYISTPLHNYKNNFFDLLIKDLHDASIDTVLPFELNVDGKYYDLEHILKSCDHFIADLTEINCNVLYETGLAQGLGIPIILIANSFQDIPSPLANHMYYTKNEFEKIVKVIHDEVRQKQEIVNSNLKLVTILKAYHKNSQELNKISNREFELKIFDLCKLKGWEPELNKKYFNREFDIFLNNYEKSSALIECKKFSFNKKVALNNVIEFLSELELTKVDNGFIITTSEFTQSAINFVSKLKNKNIELWDVNRLEKEAAYNNV